MCYESPLRVCHPRFSQAYPADLTRPFHALLRAFKLENLFDRLRACKKERERERVNIEEEKIGREKGESVVNIIEFRKSMGGALR